MKGSPGIETARSAWRALPASLRAEVARAIAPPSLVERSLSRLTRLLEERLLEVVPGPPVPDERLDRLLHAVCAPLFREADDPPESAFAAAYAGRLLALALPLSPEDAAGQPRRTRDLVERAADHELLAPAALEAALADLADDLMRQVGTELTSKVVESFASTGAAPSSSWLDHPDRLLLSVDQVTMSCARYLAGLQLPARDRYGYDELDAGRGGRTKRVDMVTVKFEPRSGTDAAVGEAPEGSELKAKLFVALFALAAEAKNRGQASPIRVRLRDLLRMMGFRLGTATNSDYYWRYASQLTRYMLADLPNRVVAMQVTVAGQPRVLFEPLLAHVRALDPEGKGLDSGRLVEDLQAGPAAIRRRGAHGFEFTLSDELLEAHGIGRALNAVEHVPVRVLALRGPAFWLAWQVAFLRRWAVVPASGAQGKPLLRSLEEAGHLAAATRGGRVRYRDALANWWRDTGELAAMGLLDEPGVRLYRQRGGSWRDASTEISRWLDPGGGRITRERLQEVRIVFQIPAGRAAQLAAARRRRGHRASAGMRRHGTG